MVENSSILPETFDMFEEMAEFWDTHDATDFEEYLAPVNLDVALHPKHEYVITLSSRLNQLLQKAQQHGKYRHNNNTRE